MNLRHLVWCSVANPCIIPKILAQHLEVAELLGLSLILVRGWAFHDKNLGSLIDHPALIIWIHYLFLGYSLVYQRYSFMEVITLAEAIRADCQVVVEPFEMINSKCPPGSATGLSACRASPSLRPNRCGQGFDDTSQDADKCKSQVCLRD